MCILQPRSLEKMTNMKMESNYLFLGFLIMKLLRKLLSFCNFLQIFLQISLSWWSLSCPPYIALHLLFPITSSLMLSTSNPLIPLYFFSIAFIPSNIFMNLLCLLFFICLSQLIYQGQESLYVLFTNILIKTKIVPDTQQIQKLLGIPMNNFLFCCLQIRVIIHDPSFPY